MTGASFVHCPGCGRLMLGQHGYPQPHECQPSSIPSEGSL